jgi:DNA topoisomerase-1
MEPKQRESDRRLAVIVRSCREIPGQRLFQYVDEEGKRHAIGSGDVNDYLRTVALNDFSAKDFRTWAATLMAAKVFHKSANAASQVTKSSLAQCIQEVARHFGNTAAVCRKSYIHPALIEACASNSLPICNRQSKQEESQECRKVRFEKPLEMRIDKRHSWVSYSPLE